jgi:hypothetical protein
MPKNEALACRAGESGCESRRGLQKRRRHAPEGKEWSHHPVTVVKAGATPAGSASNGACAGVVIAPG